MTKIFPLIGSIILFSCSNEAEKKSNNTQSAIEVDYIVAQETPMDYIIEIPGTIMPSEMVELFSEIPGRIVTINFKEGQRVRKGELLFKIDSELLEAQLNQLKVDLELAQKDEQRKKNLLASKAISLEEYEQVQSRYYSLQAQIAYVRVQISKASIIAPFSGKLGLRHVSEGAYVTPATKLISIAQDDKVKIEFSIAERYANRVQPGSRITLKTANDTTMYTALVYAYEPSVDQGTRMLTVRAETEGQSNLFPGSYVAITYNLGKDPHSIMIPATALVPILKGQKIWLIKDGKAKSVMVEPGIRTHKDVQVWGEINVGDTVVLSGLLGMREGIDVKGKTK